MSIQPEHLLTLAVVSRTGSVSAAAEHLHRSQPAISTQLKLLSEELGETLYVRHRHGVTLTPAGAALLPFAQTLSRTLAGAERLVADFKTLKRGKLSIAASMTNAVYLLPQVLTRFRQLYPGVELELLTRNTQEAVALMAFGEVDLALVEGPVGEASSDLVYQIVTQDDLVLVTLPGHPLATQAHLALTDLRGLEVVQREAGSGTRNVVEQALAQHGVTLRVVLEATGIEAVKEAVLAGLGAGFISRLALRREVAAGILVTRSLGEAFRRPLTLLRPQEAACSRAARSFVALLAKETNF